MQEQGISHSNSASSLVNMILVIRYN